ELGGRGSICGKLRGEAPLSFPQIEPRPLRLAMLALALSTASMAQTPAEFPPMGNDLTDAERASVQSAITALGERVAGLKRQYPGGAQHDRIADVEVYLEAVRRPLKYGERLYAPKGTTPAEYAIQTLKTGAERAELLAAGRTPWMSESGVRGFYSKLDGSAQPYILTMPDRFDPAARREYRLDIFLHGRD